MVGGPEADEIVGALARRLGEVRARERLHLETRHPRRGRRRTLDLEKLEPLKPLIIALLDLAGFYERGLRNAERILLRHNYVVIPHLPAEFDGYRILQLTDLHIEANPVQMARVSAMLESDLPYDLCVLTGDFRASNKGPFEPALDGLRRLRGQLREPVYAVLGNHDTIQMVPGMEELGLRVLLNERVVLRRGARAICLCGIDDAHYIRAHDLQQAEPDPGADVSILLSHTPEVYREAEAAGFDLMLSGHTHGGQICLPGPIPIMLCAPVPRNLGAGPWAWRGLQGYTSSGLGCSLLPVRFNCPPEITLHHLLRERKLGVQS